MQDSKENNFEKKRLPKNSKKLISGDTINSIISQDSNENKIRLKVKDRLQQMIKKLDNKESNCIEDFSDKKLHEKKIQEYSNKIKLIHQEYYDNNKLFEDEEFCNLNKFLFRNEQSIDEAYIVFKNWEYLRPEEITKNFKIFDKENPYNYEIRMGKYSSVNFLNAVSCLTTEEYYENVFVDIENIHMGYISCRFFKNGQWHYVIVDTMLPYSKETKKFLFSHNDNHDIFWVALLEKAYAKLHGNYEYLNNLNFEDILEDLTNGYVTKIDLKDNTKKEFIESKKLFNYLMNFTNTKEKYFLICMRKNKQSKNSNKLEMGEYGILENFAHSILSLEDVTNREFKFFRIRNFWGSETNWSGPFSKNSDEWDKYKNLRDEFLHSKKFMNDFQNIYFMKYEYFVKEFNKIYIVKVFDENKWFNYSCKSLWNNKTLGGPPNDLNSIFPQDQGSSRVFTQKDSDPGWFNNPQFRIKVFRKTKLYISLVQHDSSVGGQNSNYINTNFYLIKNKKGFNKIWEFPKESKIILCAKKETPVKHTNNISNLEEDKVINNTSTYNNQKSKSQFLKNKSNMINNSKVSQNNENNDNGDNKSDVSDESEKVKKIKRKISSFVTLDIFDNKKNGNYNLVVNTMKNKFSKDIPFFIKIFADSEIVFEPLPETIDYVFTNTWDKNTAGGPYYPYPKNLKNNSFWCLNPQYLINFHKPTFIKIILQKTGKNAKKNKFSKLGLSLCFLHSDKNLEYYQINQPELEQKITNKKDDKKIKILKKVQKYLHIPFLQKVVRKILIKKNENFIESSYSSPDISCLFLKVLPVEGPLLIVPALESPDILCDFKIQFFTNTEIDIKELDPFKNPVIISEWTQYNSGGSHIYNEKLYSNPDKSTWSLNPLFELKFLDYHNFDYKTQKINIRLNLCEQNWKTKILTQKKTVINSNNKKTKNTLINVDCMVSFYILKISKRIALSDIIYQTPFSPKSEIDYEFLYNPQDFDKRDSLYIMPVTYNPGIEAKFIISAYCDSPISLSKA